METLEELPNGNRWADYGHEIKKVTVIALPMVVVALLPYLMQMVAVIMVGHVDELSLSSLAIATSLTNVTGFSLLSGLVGGLETLYGQAFGAKQHNKIGGYTCSAIISLLFVCIPISISWIFIDKFLILIGHDPLISHEARKYSIYLIPSLFFGAIVKPLVRLLQSQSLTMPLLVSSTLVLCFHAPLCWGLIFKLKMGSVGAATAFSLSNWFYLMLMVFYFKFSSLCKNVGVTFSMDALIGMKEFFWFAIPSAVMVCLKCLTISTLHFTIPYGFGAAARGIARGSGWQHIGAYVTLVAFYLFGMPTAIVLGFPLHLKAKGLWIGIVIGSIIQSGSLLFVTRLTDWQKQGNKGA
ncbi:hypothetical protein Lser_V15G12543 [Lactuca serriola]